MPSARRTRKILASPETVWEVVEDPQQMPRWWPGVRRMEGVDRDRFTQVFTTKKGRSVRLDFRVLQSEPPHRRMWEQELPGGPLERVLAEDVTRLSSSPRMGQPG